MNRDWRDRRLQRKLRMERLSKYHANRRATEHQRKGYVVYDPVVSGRAALIQEKSLCPRPK
jgi:hypothetical protein